MRTYSMAVDIGASSGRCILGWMENGKIRIEEIHRFGNGSVDKNGVMIWEADRLFDEILAGLKKAGEMGKRPDSVGVDTWGVDYVLLDADDKLLGDPVCYRDPRTKGMDVQVGKFISQQDLYARTGTQFMLINTIYQLMSVKTAQPGLLERARSLLLTPEYINFRLTGVKMHEYTNCSTTNLLNAESCQWDRELLARLGYPDRIFGEVREPGTVVGALRPEIREAVGYDTTVVLPPAHDTAAAVMAMPMSGEDCIYISSGTWSLMGIERPGPDCRDICRLSGFTNEGGYQRRYRFLKNIMGLWMIQSLRRELMPDSGFADVIAAAEKGMGCGACVDVNDDVFLAPASMKDAIVRHCVEAGGEAPATDAEVIACAYKSLVNSYVDTAKQIEELAGRTFDRINIFGGGCQDALLNRLTAEATGKEVYAGPVEATALGNILCQMLRRGEFSGLVEARQAVADSFEVSKVL